MINSLTGRLALGGLVVVVSLLAGLAVWGTVEAERASRPLVGGLEQADGQLDAMRTIGRLHAALDA